MKEDCKDNLEIRPWPNQDDLCGLFIEPKKDSSQTWAKIPVERTYTINAKPKKSYTLKFEVDLSNEQTKEFIEKLVGNEFTAISNDHIGDGVWDEDNSEITVTWEAGIPEDWNTAQ